MSEPPTARARVRKVRGDRSEEIDDAMAAEEPLEIRIVERTNGGEHEQSLAVTMRTPGHDRELAAGFLFSEGTLRRPDDLTGIEPGRPRAAEEAGNVIRVLLREGATVDASRTTRSFYTTASCGVCGK